MPIIDRTIGSQIIGYKKESNSKSGLEVSAARERPTYSDEIESNLVSGQSKIASEFLCKKKPRKKPKLTKVNKNSAPVLDIRNWLAEWTEMRDRINRRRAADLADFLCFDDVDETDFD